MYDFSVVSRSVESGSLLIDSSTIDQATVTAMAERATEVGASYIDAPVSGGTATTLYPIYYSSLTIPRPLSTLLLRYYSLIPKADMTLALFLLVFIDKIKEAGEQG